MEGRATYLPAGLGCTTTCPLSSGACDNPDVPRAQALECPVARWLSIPIYKALRSYARHSKPEKCSCAGCFSPMFPCDGGKVDGTLRDWNSSICGTT